MVNANTRALLCHKQKCHKQKCHKQKRHKPKCHQQKQQGNVMLEVAALLPIFLFIVFSALELARGLIIYASLNHVMSEAARQVKLFPASKGNYQVQLLHAMTTNSASLLDSSKLVVEQGRFYDSPEQLANQESSDNASTLHAPLAKYKVSYQVTLLSPWLQNLLPFSADILVKHEF